MYCSIVFLHKYVKEVLGEKKDTSIFWWCQNNTTRVFGPTTLITANREGKTIFKCTVIMQSIMKASYADGL